MSIRRSLKGKQGSEWQGEEMGDFERQVGKRIREARIKRYKGTVTMTDLAKILGVPFRTYQNWELGIRPPKYGMIIKLANILKTDPAHLLFGHKQKNSEAD